MRYDQATLPNGLELVGEYRPDALSCAVGFFCRTGSRDEVAAESGVSHFLEHMMFKGTETLSYDDINRIFDEMGARSNAFTNEENTVYFGQVLPEHQPRLTELLARMMRPALRAADFDMEKKVILEEIAMYDDMPHWVAYDRCRELHYGDHALRNSVLGTSASITELSREQMADYFARRYASDNLTVAAAGHYDWDALVAQIETLCGGWQPAGAGRELPPAEPGARLAVYPSERHAQAHIVVMAPGIAAQDERRWAAAVLASVIGLGTASRLHWALVDPGIAEQASLSHDAEDQAGAYGGNLVCEPERAQQALDLYRGVLAEVQDAGVTADEVARAVRRFASGFTLGAESPLGRLINVGSDWVYRRRVTPLDEAIAALRAVTVDDCRALLAERPFDHLSVACVGPLTELH